MRPSDTVYSTRVELPEHLRALRGQLGGGGAQAPPETLGPVTALDELLAVLEVAIDGPAPPQSSADRVSLKDDVLDAFKSLGPELDGHLGPAWKSFVGDVAELPKNLMQQPSARVVRGGAQALRSALVAPEAAAAAWNDVVTVFESGHDAELCELRVLQLRQVVEARGHVWKTIRRRLEGLLNDDPDSMPDIDESQHDNNDHGRPLANVPLADRLRRASGAVSAEAPTGELVVWVAFQHAWLDGSYLRLGPVEFFAHQMWPESIRAGNYTTDGVGPPELDEDHSYALRGMPDEDFVLARVELGEGPLGGAIDRARDLVQDLVRTALPTTDWQLMDGAAAYLSGPGWNWNTFEDPRMYEDAQRGDPKHESTGFELEEVDERFAKALARADAEAVDVAEYVRWEVALRQIPEVAQRVVLSTRVLERGLPGEYWSDATKRYLHDSWGELRLGFWLRDAAFAMLSVHPGRWSNGGAEEDKEAYIALKDALTPSAGRMSFKFHGDRALRMLPPMAPDTPEGSMERRLLDELIRRTESGQAAAGWLAVFERRFDRLLARTVRQRNAVIHGGRIVPAVLSTIEPFVGQLVGRVVAEKVHAVGSGTSAEQAMDEVRAAVSGRRERLQGGELAEDVLF